MAAVARVRADGRHLGRPDERLGAGSTSEVWAAMDLELADYESLFARKRIVTGVRQTPPDERAPLYRRILGDAYARLPEPLRVMHDVDGALTAEGVATVERGTSLLSRLAGWIVAFPPAGENVPITVAFRARDGREQPRRVDGD